MSLVDSSTESVKTGVWWAVEMGLTQIETGR
jgi:hypothetical protein